MHTVTFWDKKTASTLQAIVLIITAKHHSRRGAHHCEERRVLGDVGRHSSSHSIKINEIYKIKYQRRIENRTRRNLSKATVLKIQKRVRQEPSGRRRSSVNGTVTTLPINTRRSSTKWRSGKYHLTGRTEETYHRSGVCVCACRREGGALRQS